MRYYIFFLGLILLSCNKNEDALSKTPIKDKDTVIVQKNEDISFVSKTPIQKLHSEAIKVMEDWQEYQSVAAFMPKFRKTTTKEVLLNSNQFHELTTYLKDSIRLKRFKTMSIRTRLNVLHNEALRLFDMDSIPSITNKEIIHETENIINAFSALNSKINSVIKRDLLTESLIDIPPVLEDKELIQIKKTPSKSSKKQKVFQNRKFDKKLLKNKRIKPLPKKKKELFLKKQ